MIGHRLLGNSLPVVGDFAQGLARLDRALALYDPAAHRRLVPRFGQDIGVAIQSSSHAIGAEAVRRQEPAGQQKFPYFVPAWHLCRRHYAAHLGRRTISPERSRNAALIESGGLAL